MIVFEEVYKEADLFDESMKRLLKDIIVKQKNHQQCFDMLLSEFDVSNLSDDCKIWITYNFARTYVNIVQDRAIKTAINITIEEYCRFVNYSLLYRETGCDKTSKFLDLVVDVSNTKGKGFFETLYEIWLTGIVSEMLESGEL